MAVEIRRYPSVEGIESPDGTPYLRFPVGQIRPELQKYIDCLKDVCHTKSVGLIVESLNDGVHTELSMHYRGLAIDWNGYRIDPLRGKSMRLYTTFEEQDQISIVAAQLSGYNTWIWKDDNQSHTHCSVHPLKA